MDKFGVALGEASTWRGLLALTSVAGVHLAPEQADAIVTAGVSLYGLIGVFFRRGG